jgi:hypothetical protein
MRGKSAVGDGETESVAGRQPVGRRPERDGDPVARVGLHRHASTGTVAEREVEPAERDERRAPAGRDVAEPHDDVSWRRRDREIEGHPGRALQLQRRLQGRGLEAE